MEIPPSKRLHPLIAVAAAAVIVAAAIAVAAMTGKLPGSSADTTAQPPQATAGASAPASKPAPKTAPIPRQVAVVTQTKRNCANCGVVVDVKVVEVKGEGTGLGAVAGGVAGAVIGNEIGEGKHRKLVTVAGAAGGAIAGHEIEKHARTTKRFDVGVRMDDGSLRSVSSETEPAWRSGDRVRIQDGRLEPIK